ncbi:MAG: YCF48-related protein [Acidobacteriota bacterium]
MMRFGILFFMLCLVCPLVAAQWIEQSSGAKARLRAVSAVSNKIAWASGANGTCLKTVDGGATWQLLKVPGAESLDFRDVDAFDADTAYLLSIGEGEKSRIYKTTDGGRTWQLQFTNHNPKAFFDAMAFWDAKGGIAISDPVDGHLLIIKTTDGGATWTEVPAAKIPPALANEAAFAASGTCITVQGRNNAWIATGGGAARVFRSTDGGNTWQVATTPIISGGQATGNFSIAFKDAKHGVIVGGDYTKESEARDNAAVTSDGGRTWALTKSLPGGFRSGVVYVRAAKAPAILAVGPKGTDYTLDNGASWTSLGAGGYHAVGFAGATAWAVGEGGRVGKHAGNLSGKNKASP